jgi:hypothetical protein
VAASSARGFAQMTTTLFKQVSYTAQKLISEIESGEVGLPDIQRPFVWKRAKVRDLFDSMYAGFPVGYLLFWANAGGAKRTIGTGAKQRAPRLLIVDGQQRLTSLFAVLKGVPVIDENYAESHIQIAFRPKDATFDVADATTKRDPEYIDDITKVFTESVRQVGRDFLRTLRESREVSEGEEDRLLDSLDRLSNVQNYPFTVLELAAEVDEERVAEVFVRINSEGVALNQADFILTLLSVFWDDGRRQLEDFSRAAKQPSTSRPSPFNHFIQPSPDQLLRASVGLAFRRGRLKSVYSLLRGRDMSTGEYSDERREEQFAKLGVAQAVALDLTNWHEFLKSLIRAGFRSGSTVTSENSLLFAYILFLIGRRDYGVDLHRLREVMARWFFMASLTGRYTSSPESAIEADLGRLSGVTGADGFVAMLEQNIDNALTSDFWTIGLPNSLATSAARSPSLSAYYASLNILDARVLFSKMRVTELFDPALRSKKAALERHHLFPRAYLAREGIASNREINQIANFALVEWPDNIAISDTPPAEYFHDFMSRLSESEQKRARFWHALPQGWETMEYGTFLEARRGLIAQVVKAAFEQLSSATMDEADDLGSDTSPRKSVDALMKGGESAQVEFKSSARWNLHTKTRDEKLEHVIVKTIAGFMNADGGTLLIGVNDDGQALGLDNDYALLRKQDRDGFELWLTDLCEAHLGRALVPGVSVSFAEVDGKDVCRVDVRASTAPVFVRAPKAPKTADFFVRTGNSTRQLMTDDVLRYEKERWGVAD